MVKKNIDKKKVYDNPEYYEIAFSYRDIPLEVDFLEKLIKKHSKIPVKTFFELASGNSPHMEELCRRGYKYIGLEINSEMADYAENKIKKADLNAEIIQGDMVQFDLTESADCAMVFLGSLYVKSDEELKKHLNSLASALKSGGIYIIDGVVSFYAEDVHAQTWQTEKNNIKIAIIYKAEWLDEKQSLLEGKITLDIQDGDKKKQVEHTEIRKVYTADEFVSLAEKTGFWEHVGSFSDFDIDKLPQKKARNILVLRRK
jgi:SAM-dependent methyltransferase